MFTGRVAQERGKRLRIKAKTRSTGIFGDYTAARHFNTVDIRESSNHLSFALHLGHWLFISHVHCYYEKEPFHASCSRIPVDRSTIRLIPAARASRLPRMVTDFRARVIAV